MGYLDGNKNMPLLHNYHHRCLSPYSNSKMIVHSNILNAKIEVILKPIDTIICEVAVTSYAEIFNLYFLEFKSD